MINCIIVEDDVQHSERLVKLLKNVDGQIHICEICTNVSDGLAAINKYTPELVFLDVLLDFGESGFDLIRKSDEHMFDVIFTTGEVNPANAINAIRACALDFLPKPIDLKELNEAISRFTANRKSRKEQIQTLKSNLEMLRNEDKAIWIAEGDKNIRVDISDILYGESENSTTFFYLIKEVNGKTKVTSTTSIGKWEGILDKFGFCRLHASFLVNLKHIKEYSRGESSVKVSNKKVLPVSRQRKEELLSRLELVRFH